MGSVILFGIKQAIKIIMGVALTLGIFFGVGWLVDWNATRSARMPDSPKFWPYSGKLERRDKDLRPHVAAPTSPAEQLPAQDALRDKGSQPLLPSSPSSPGEKSLSTSVQREHALPKDNRQAVVPEKTPEQAAASSAQSLLTYTIQLGSFQNAEVAKAFSDKLVAKGYPAYVLQTDVEGKGTVYRVRVGRFTTMEEAQGMAMEIEKKESVSAFITSK